MREIQKYSSLTSLILLLFICGNSFFAQNAFAQNDPEAIAKEHFELGKYEEALPFFKDLVNLYPKDPMLNYYYAACLVETKQFTEEVKTAIQNAYGDETPAKIFYYQAQIFHAEDNFEQAASLYQQFADKAKRKVVKNTKTEELLKLCEQNINPFPKPKVEEVTEETAEEDTTWVEEVIEVEKPLEIPSDLKNSLIFFHVTPTIHYLKINHFKNEASIQLFIEGWQIEQELNTSLEETNNLRNDYATASENEKITLAEQILQLEKETYTLNQQVQQFYLSAKEKEIAYWDNANPIEMSDFKRKISILEDSIANAKMKVEIEETGVAVPVELPEERIETVVPDVTQPTTDQVVYKIQIGAYKKSPPQWVQNLYKKLSVIRRIDKYTDEKGVTVYTVGELSSFEDALLMQAQVRQEGVKDAFVAAYKNGERIPVKEARELTN